MPLDGETYAHTSIMEQSLQFVRNNYSQPFFLYLPITIPHAAMQAPEADMAAWRKVFPEFENVVGKYAGKEINNPVAAFAAMMTIVDRNVAEQNNLADDNPQQIVRAKKIFAEAHTPSPLWEFGSKK